jgi:hypothetical protein
MEYNPNWRMNMVFDWLKDVVPSEKQILSGCFVYAIIFLLIGFALGFTVCLLIGGQ